MNRHQAWTAYGSTSLFVLGWSSGAIVAKLSLAYASPFAFLLLRFVVALAALVLIAWRRKRWLPPRGARLAVARAGLFMLGGYTVCYLLALAHGLTPGMLATVLGVQPLVTLLVTERRIAPLRALGLALALAGLVLVVWQGMRLDGLGVAGMLYALGALFCISAGAILQKRSGQDPLTGLPLQYALSLVLCLALAPTQPLWLVPGFGLAWTLAWLGLVISVGATLLFYRLIAAGNLVNVTSLFYLVPLGTAALDWLLLGNVPAPQSVAGMAAILAGLALALRAAR